MGNFLWLRLPYVRFITKPSQNLSSKISVPKSPSNLLHSLCTLTFSVPIQGLLPSPAPRFSAMASGSTQLFLCHAFLSICSHNIPKSQSLPHVYPVLINLSVNTPHTSQGTAYRFMWFLQVFISLSTPLSMFFVCLFYASDFLGHLSLHHLSDFYTSFKIQLRNSLF